MSTRGYVYILASKSHANLYVGVTNDLTRRVWQHKNHAIEGFTRRHRVNRLVYFERYEDISEARIRERELKGLTRASKLALVEDANPAWSDLYTTLNGASNRLAGPHLVG